MKKYILFCLLLLCIVIWGCGSKTANTIDTSDVDDIVSVYNEEYAEKDKQCEQLLDSVILSKKNLKEDDHVSMYKDFDIFYSKKYDTCVATYYLYENIENDEFFEYVAEDMMYNDNVCFSSWYKYQKEWSKWHLSCFWKFAELFGKTEGISMMELDNFSQVLDWFDYIVDNLKEYD